MVLTNIELWAADGSSGSSLPIDFESNNPHARHLNPFDPRAVPQRNSNLNHLSSNGYYGFSYINAAHDAEINNNNNNNNNISDINHLNSNNSNNAIHNIMPNQVDDGMDTIFLTATTTPIQQTHALSVNFGSAAYADVNATNIGRCKKRFFVMNEDDDDEDGHECSGTNKNNCYSNNNCEVAAKRCRFDDDFSAQYCNDFFQLPSTQIATQSCLMDTEEGLQQQLQPQQTHQPHQQQQQHVDVAMFENNNNIEKFEQKLNPQLPNLNASHQQQHSQQQMQSSQQTQQLQQQQQQQQHLYHQQQHYQDIQLATIKCHFSHNNNNQNNNNNNKNCDTIALNNRTCKIDLKRNTANVLGIRNPNLTSSSIQNEHDKYVAADDDDAGAAAANDDDDDGVAANDFKVDDATLFAQLHGGCLHHHRTSSSFQ